MGSRERHRLHGRAREGRGRGGRGEGGMKPKEGRTLLPPSPIGRTMREGIEGGGGGDRMERLTSKYLCLSAFEAEIRKRGLKMKNSLRRSTVAWFDRSNFVCNERDWRMWMMGLWIWLWFCLARARRMYQRIG